MTGGCACGAIRWELSEPPLGMSLCHCRRCQRRTGTAVSPSVLTAPGSMTITQGEELLEVWVPDDGWLKFFCGQCGSAIYTQHPEASEMIAMRAGGFDSDPGVRPGFHQFVAYAAEWDPIPDDGLPRFDERAPFTKPD